MSYLNHKYCNLYAAHTLSVDVKELLFHCKLLFIVQSNFDIRLSILLTNLYLLERSLLNHRIK